MHSSTAVLPNRRMPPRRMLYIISCVARDEVTLAMAGNHTSGAERTRPTIHLAGPSICPKTPYTPPARAVRRPEAVQHLEGEDAGRR